MKKKLMSALLIITLSASFTACGSGKDNTVDAAGNPGTDAASQAAETTVEETAAEPEKKEPDVTLVMAESRSADSLAGQTDRYFIEKVEELSGGTVSIDLRTSEELGSDIDVLDLMKSPEDDSIDLARISPSALALNGCTKAGLLSLPYTWESKDHFWNFVNSDLARDFLDEPLTLDMGVQGVFYGESGFYNFFTDTIVKSPEELSGMNLRISDNPAMNKTVEAFGAVPRIIRQDDISSALKAGLINGTDMKPADYLEESIGSDASYAILDNHTLDILEVVAADSALEKLDDSQKKALFDAGKAAADYNKELSKSQDEENTGKMRSLGIVVTESSDTASWRSACQSVIDEYSADQGDLYEKLLTAAG